MQLQPDVKKIHDLRDSACYAAQVLTERIHRDPDKADYQTTYDAAKFAFRLLSLMKERGATLLGADARVRLRQSLGQLQKTKRACPYFCDFGSELDKAIKHIDEILHAITMFRPQRPNGGAKTPAQPTESGDQQADAATWDRTMSPIAIEEDGSVTVLGKSKSVTPAQFVVLEKLVDAYPNGLVKDSLEADGCTAARRTLKRLADADPDFANVISFPGQTGQGRGYCLIWPESS